jgi:predicted AlkP superfamily pyrophosphatase or phosphodiesterase
MTKFRHSSFVINWSFVLGHSSFSIILFPMRLIKKVLTFLVVVLLGQQGLAAGRASHVVLIVWDGMRPDFVSEATTPALFALARDGVTFLHHHPVYPSITEVNATALATGVYPWQSGIIGNHEFRPAFDAFEPVNTDSLAVARRGDALTGNHYLAFPTVAEILREHGLRTAVAGTKPVALLHDRAPRPAGSLGVDVFAGHALPEAMEQSLARALGKFPESGPNKTDPDQWTTRALTGPLWQKEVPAFSVLWLAEPDYSQHQTGPGSKASLAAIQSSDRNLARVLKALRKKHLQDSTDVIVVSDHGFSTILENIDVAAVLQAHGFHAWRKFPETERKDGDIMVVGNGGVFFCYVTGHDPDLIAQLVHFFQAQPFSGVIFSQKPVDGAFPLADAGLDSSYAPDIVVAMRWEPERSQYGVPGLIYCTGGPLGPGQGQHASLSPSDMHNLCIAFGPDFARGMKDPLPSGNIDIAPTILWILGIEPKQKMSGRVLGEALTVAWPGIQSNAPRHRQTEWKGNGFVWRQYLDTSQVNGVTYLDQGNGGQISP